MAVLLFWYQAILFILLTFYFLFCIFKKNMLIFNFCKRFLTQAWQIIHQNYCIQMGFYSYVLVGYRISYLMPSFSTGPLISFSTGSLISCPLFLQDLLSHALFFYRTSYLFFYRISYLMPSFSTGSLISCPLFLLEKYFKMLKNINHFCETDLSNIPYSNYT